MSPQTFIFVGRSGSGKGTQADLLNEYLKAADPGREVFYLEMGDKYKKFIEGSTLTSQLSRKIFQEGSLQPEFLTVWMWAGILIENLKGGEHLVLDGTPRRLREALALDSAFRFYERKIPQVLYMNVSPEWSKNRLKERGRSDDKTDEDMNRKIRWFDMEVTPVLEYFKESRNYTFLEINGQQSVEEVHKEIISKITLS